jgi:limonene-1,2-epoxide hydrolase
MTKTKTADVVRDYNRALEARDFDAARSHLADDLRFEGPIDRFEKADDYIAALKGLYGQVKGVRHLATLSDGDEVAVFSTLEFPMVDAPVAEWYTIRGDRITHLRVYFDARPFAPPPR